MQQVDRRWQPRLLGLPSTLADQVHVAVAVNVHDHDQVDQDVAGDEIFGRARNINDGSIGDAHGDDERAVVRAPAAQFRIKNPQ
jgi:hypothetical protein